MRLRPALPLALALMLGAVPSPARVTPNPAGRAVLDPSGPRQAPLRTSAATAQPVGLTPGAIALDSTWYDLQDMGSLGHHIEVGPDGRVHVTWQDDMCELSGQCPPNLNLPQPYPFRGQVYAYRDVSGIWHNVGKVQDPRVAGLRCCAAPEEFGGFGTVALTPSGRAIVSQHMNEDSCDLHGNFYLEDAPGGATWTSYLSPISGGSSFLFPQAAMTPGGGVTLLGEVPVAGVYDETVQIGTSWFPTTGTLYTCFNWQGQAWSNLVPGVVPASLFRDGRPAFPSLSASSNGRVGVAVGDFGGNVYLIESSNGTFAANTVTIRNLTGTTDAQVTAGDSTSSQFRAYVHCHLAYNDTTPNVVWSELQARRVGGVVSFFDWHSRIRHWSPDRGVETVYQVPAGVAGRFANVDNGLNGPLGGFNSLAVDWPQVGFSDDGSETYVVWQRCVDAEVDPTADMGLTGICTGVGFADLACSVARASQAWSGAENLTKTPNTDERFFSLATRNPGGRLHLVYQASATDQAGCALIGDRGTTPGNLLRRIAYLEVRPAASVLAVGDGGAGAPAVMSALRVSPNPVFGAARVTFAAGADPNPNRRVEVYSLDGRRVVSLSYLRGGAATWDGRDDSGRRVPAGVYFARLSDSEPNRATRFVLAH